VPFFGDLKELVFLKIYIGHYLQRMYKEHKDNPYVGIFTFDQPSLGICHLDTGKNTVLKETE
jgi:hypothetical protein